MSLPDPKDVGVRKRGKKKARRAAQDVDTTLFKYLDRDCDRRWAHGVKALVEYRAYLVRTIQNEIRLLALLDRTDGWKIRKFKQMMARALRKRELAVTAEKTLEPALRCRVAAGTTECVLPMTHEGDHKGGDGSKWPRVS